MGIYQKRTNIVFLVSRIIRKFGPCGIMVNIIFLSMPIKGTVPFLLSHTTLLLHPFPAQARRVCVCMCV